MALLIESNLYAVNSIVIKTVPSFIPSFSRFLRRNSSDEEFLDLMERDPFLICFITTRWTKEYVKWVEDILKIKPTNRKVIVFGEDQDG